jgi:hypothetical protein
LDWKFVVVDGENSFHVHHEEGYELSKNVEQMKDDDEWLRFLEKETGNFIKY